MFCANLAETPYEYLWTADRSAVTAAATTATTTAAAETASATASAIGGRLQPWEYYTNSPCPCVHDAWSTTTIAAKCSAFARS